MKKLIIFLAILFISCSSPKPPKWYNKIYNDNNFFVYSTGVGQTKKEAITNALANASAKISVIVQSHYKSLKYQYKGDDTSNYSNNSIFNIETKTNPITFTQYKILKLQNNDKYYVLLKINRLKNAKYMCNNINITHIDNNNLNVFLNYKKIISSLNKKIKKLRSINTLYPICKDKLTKTITLKNQILKTYNNLTLSIVSQNKTIQNLLENILNIKTTSRGNIKIYTKQKIKYKKVGNYKIATIYITLSIKSQNKSKNYSLTCAASSIEDFNIAKELAYQECKQKLKKLF